MDTCAGPLDLAAKGLFTSFFSHITTGTLGGEDIIAKHSLPTEESEQVLLWEVSVALTMRSDAFAPRWIGRLICDDTPRVVFAMTRFSSDAFDWRTARLAVRMSDVRQIARCVIREMRRMHENGIAHMDISLENILVQTNADGDCIDAVICDPGLSHALLPSAEFASSMTEEERDAVHVTAKRSRKMMRGTGWERSDDLDIQSLELQSPATAEPDSADPSIGVPIEQNMEARQVATIRSHLERIRLSSLCASIARDKSVKQWYRPVTDVPIIKMVYQAPEIIRRERSIDPLACDVWSFGVCMFALAFGRMPFNVAASSDHSFDTFTKDGRLRDVLRRAGGIPLHSVNEDRIIDMIQKCLRIDPASRLTVHELCTHPFAYV